ncbi:MAG TPA: alpha-2-macroglobulin family protein, partial [Blastocatellia bacterium]|nr:alpha-2-macroglobulin family protein [Blastocatellia bacterium]
KNEYKPREKASYSILARNADGSPAPNAEVSLGVVDEAVYSIRPDSSGDIRRTFYGHRYDKVQTRFSASDSFTGYSGDKPVTLAAARRAYQLADFKNESQYVDPIIRKDFKDTAFWQADVVTGADGKAAVSVPLPDNLTTWRATARAVTADTRVGSSIVKVVERKNLILRLEAPRFLTKGDTVTLSGIVHNYLDSDKTVAVSLDVEGATLLDAASLSVTVPKQGEQRLNWRVSASQVGKVTLLGKALTNEESDAVQLPLPVVAPGLQYTSGGVTAISDETAEKTVSLDVPSSAESNARTLHIEVTPSVAGSLFGALDYLTTYPYGCTEQTMSSFLPNVVVAQALKDVSTTSIRSDNNLKAKVGRGLDRLYSFQHEDGGWGWWKDDKTDPFMTAYVVDGLTLAGRAGFSVDGSRAGRGREALKRLIAANKTESGAAIDLESRAYMIYALRSSGEADPHALDDLFNRRGELQPYGRALLALTLKLNGDTARARQVAKEIESGGNNSEAGAHWQSQRRPMLDFSEDDTIEGTALSIKALAEILPSSPVLPAAARWLVANRRFGYYWDSTRQTAFAIFGLTAYLKVSKELNPNYAVEVYLNGKQLFAHQITAADTSGVPSFTFEQKDGDVATTNQVRIVKRGPGVVYVSTTVAYFSTEADTRAASSNELALTREYMRLKVVSSGDKSKWVVEPLSGDLRSGDLIVARLHVKGARAQYMMIEDPIPAGCEQVEQVDGVDLDNSDGKWTSWYSNREFRDQRTVLFLNYFSGDATFQYALRVQIPGQFRAGASRATLMYSPWVQSNTAPAGMRILDKK